MCSCFRCSHVCLVGIRRNATSKFFYSWLKYIPENENTPGYNFIFPTQPPFLAFLCFQTTVLDHLSTEIPLSLYAMKQCTGFVQEFFCFYGIISYIIKKSQNKRNQTGNLKTSPHLMTSKVHSSKI